MALGLPRFTTLRSSRQGRLAWISPWARPNWETVPSRQQTCTPPRPTTFLRLANCRSLLRRTSLRLFGPITDVPLLVACEHRCFTSLRPAALGNPAHPRPDTDPPDKRLPSGGSFVQVRERFIEHRSRGTHRKDSLWTNIVSRQLLWLATPLFSSFWGRHQHSRATPSPACLVRIRSARCGGCR
jgi:hypothetical protein